MRFLNWFFLVFYGGAAARAYLHITSLSPKAEACAWPLFSLLVTAHALSLAVYHFPRGPLSGAALTVNGVLAAFIAFLAVAGLVSGQPAALLFLPFGLVYFANARAAHRAIRAQFPAIGNVAL